MHIKATVAANNSRDSVTLEKGRYKICVREPATEGRANTAAKRLLAKHLGIPAASLSLIRGANKPAKLFLVRE